MVNDKKVEVTQKSENEQKNLTNINRKIEFYHIQWIDNDGELVNADKEFFSEMLSSLFGRVPIDDDETIFKVLKNCTKNDVEDEWFFGILGKSLNKDYPLVHEKEGGEIFGLPLDEDKELFFPSHFGVYNGQILISEYNKDSYTPKTHIATLINDYIRNKKINFIDSIRITPIFNENAEEILRNTDKLRSITIGVATGDAPDLADETNSWYSMGKNSRTPDNLYLELTIGMRFKRSNEAYKDMAKIKNDTYELFDTEIFDKLKKFSIGYKDNEGNLRNLNLIENLFFSYTDFIKMNDDTKAVDPKDAFGKIKTMYNNNQSFLNRYLADEEDS